MGRSRARGGLRADGWARGDLDLRRARALRHRDSVRILRCRVRIGIGPNQVLRSLSTGPEHEFALCCRSTRYPPRARVWNGSRAAESQTRGRIPPDGIEAELA